MLRTPMDRYRNDPQFHNLVCMMLAHIMRCDFTPSEMREAAMIACIQYEQTRLFKQHIIPKECEDALSILGEWARSDNRKAGGD